MKAVEIQMILNALDLGSYELVRRRLKQEKAAAEAIEAQRPQIYVTCDGVMKETLACNVHGYLVDTRRNKKPANVEFLAYVNSGLHPITLTAAGTLIADTVTVYAP